VSALAAHAPRPLHSTATQIRQMERTATRSTVSARHGTLKQKKKTEKNKNSLSCARETFYQHQFKYKFAKIN
jgi:hypothetical protein